MCGVILFATLFIFYLILRFRIRVFDSTQSWRDSLLLAAVFWGVLVALITELLSVLDAVMFRWLLAPAGGF